MKKLPLIITLILVLSWLPDAENRKRRPKRLWLNR